MASQPVVAAQPVLAAQPILASQPVVAPVAAPQQVVAPASPTAVNVYTEVKQVGTSQETAPSGLAQVSLLEHEGRRALPEVLDSCANVLLPLGLVVFGR